MMRNLLNPGQDDVLRGQEDVFNDRKYEEAPCQGEYEGGPSARDVFHFPIVKSC